MYAVYEITCLLPNVDERYIGYTADIDKTIDYLSDKNKPPPYIETIEEHGGWDKWMIDVLEEFETRQEAETFKYTLLTLHPKVYTMNTRKFQTRALDDEQYQQRTGYFINKAIKARATKAVSASSSSSKKK
jgi:hypothetical protein